MKLLRRRPRGEPTTTPATPDRAPRRDQGTWTGGSQMASKLGTVAILGAMACGPAALLVAMNSTAPVAAAPVVDPTQNLAAASLAGEAARQAVTVWLGATRDSAQVLTALVPGAQILTTSLPENPARFANASVASTQLQGSGVWLVLVGVDVEEPAPTPEEPPAVWRRYFSVPVVVGSEDVPTVQVLALPAPDAGPARGNEEHTDYGVLLGADDQRRATVQGFLEAQLAGTGDIDRFLTPGTVLSAISPAPYTAVRLDTLALVKDGDSDPGNPRDGDQVEAHASAQVTRLDGQVTSVQTFVTLTARAGRWEITAQHNTPHLYAPQTPDGPTPSSTGDTP